MKFTPQYPYRTLAMLLLLALLSVLAAACSLAPPTSTMSAAATTAASTAKATTAATTTPAATAATTAATTAANTAATAGPSRLTGAFTAADLVLKVGNKSFTLLEDAAPLLQLLGDQFTKTEAESCVFEGLDKTFDYGYLQVFTVPKGKQDLLDGIYLVDDRLATARGIRVGDPLADVIAAYGEKAGEGSLVYNQSGDPDNLADPSLTFIIDGDKVSAISYYSGSNNQGTDGGS
jgi:hypothetical protein